MQISVFRRPALLLASFLALTACGTSYQLPVIDNAVASEASAMFDTAQAAETRSPASLQSGVNRFRRVAPRIEPVARTLCERELQTNSDVDCNVTLHIDTEMPVRNAYFSYGAPGYRNPEVHFTIPMLRDAANDDEIAFILGHEYGHLLGQHIQKGDQQALAGAILLGAIAAYGNAQAASAGQYYDPNDVTRAVHLGGALGQRAFSQTYELESDMLGARIAAAAGYDPVRGAQYFARGESARSANGKLSFWGTHPPDEKRLAVVIATMEQIRQQQNQQ